MFRLAQHERLNCRIICLLYYGLLSKMSFPCKREFSNFNLFWIPASDQVIGQSQPSPFGHIPAVGIELDLGQFRRLRLPVLPAVDSGVADTKMTSQIFLAQRQLPADLFYPGRKITVSLFHPWSPIMRLRCLHPNKLPRSRAAGH